VSDPGLQRRGSPHHPIRSFHVFLSRVSAVGYGSA
jgi:hypothetical protein